ncbi:hypothetical protein R3P38DRAFT_2799625 [Favolaschia claudopus]|uniref:Uncharacterized protein n=1 Tax=Favolaschia claudopus TaxID=2862362 RepID=A0AAV9ZZS3_9AGAR
MPLSQRPYLHTMFSAHRRPAFNTWVFWQATPPTHAEGKRTRATAHGSIFWKTPTLKIDARTTSRVAMACHFRLLSLIVFEVHADCHWFSRAAFGRLEPLVHDRPGGMIRSRDEIRSPFKLDYELRFCVTVSESGSMRAMRRPVNGNVAPAAVSKFCPIQDEGSLYVDRLLLKALARHEPMTILFAKPEQEGLGCHINDKLAKIIENIASVCMFTPQAALEHCVANATVSEAPLR